MLEEGATVSFRNSDDWYRIVRIGDSNSLTLAGNIHGNLIVVECRREDVKLIWAAQWMKYRYDMRPSLNGGCRDTDPRIHRANLHDHRNSRPAV